MADDIAAGSGNALGQRIVHAEIGLHEQAHPRHARQPFQTLSIASILNDMLEGDPGLVRNGCSAEPNPFGLLKGWRDDRKNHIRELDCQRLSGSPTHAISEPAFQGFSPTAMTDNP